MSKVLLLCSGLKHTQEFVNPLLKRLEVYLSSHCDCVDVRNIVTFDERTFFEYDQVVFVFSTSMDSIPSSTLEIFQKLENQNKNNAEIYALIACDEFETEKCDLSARILEQWCIKENLKFKGSLKIGSMFFIMKTISSFVVANHIKAFAQKIIKHQDVHMRMTLLNERTFMKHANKYWNKEIRKKQKERKKL